jgi:hypothetical protein
MVTDEVNVAEIPDPVQVQVPDGITTTSPSWFAAMVALIALATSL